MVDTINRTAHARLYSGTLDSDSAVVVGTLRATVMDRLNMPALALAAGKSIAYDLSVETADVLPLPPNYDTAKRLYIALTCALPCLLTIDSPTHGTSTVRLEATTGTTDGEHSGFFVYQGTITSITVTLAAANPTCALNVFMYEIPDLTLAASYIDGSIALGVA